MPLQSLPVEVSRFALRELDPIDLVSLQQTSKHMRMLVTQFMSAAFNHRKMLLPFFETDEDIERFLTMQKRTGLVIAGSRVLGFLLRVDYGSSLDLYVASKSHASVVNDALFTLQELGFRVEEVHPFREATTNLDRSFPEVQSDHSFTLRTDPYGSTNIDKVIVMVNNKGRVIEVNIPKVSAMDALLSSHSTCVMNVMTATHAYCLYPLATLAERVTITRSASPNRSTRDALDKYELRGFEVIDTGESDASLDQRNEFRRVGDGYCWSVPLDPTSPEYMAIENPAMPRELPLFERNSWVMVRDVRMPLLPAFYLHYTTYKSYQAEESVTIADDMLLEMTTLPKYWTDDMFRALVKKATRTVS